MDNNSQQSASEQFDASRVVGIDSKAILFVCLGNICRSPAAEGIMNSLVLNSEALATIRIESAGTGGYHDGKLPDARMRQAAEKRGYKLDSRAQTITKRDFQRFNRIIAMDRDNLRAIHAVGDAKPGQLRLLSDYLGDGWPKDVPDPYYGGDEGFEYVLDMLEVACPKILAELISGSKIH